VFESKKRIEPPPLDDKLVIRKGENGERKKTVAAKIIYKDQLAIHGQKNAWVLTHVPTGYRVNGAPYDHYEDALTVAQTLKKEFGPILKLKTVEAINKKYEKISRAQKARLTVIIKRKKK